MDGSAGPQPYYSALDSVAAAHIAFGPAQQSLTLLSSPSAPTDEGQYVTIPYAVLLEWQERLRVLNDALQSLIDERRYRPSGELYAPGSNVMPLSAIGSAAWLTPPQPTSLGWAGPIDPLAFTSAPAQCATMDFDLPPGVPADMPRLDSVPSALPAAGQPSPSVTHGRRKRRAKVACGHCHATRKTCEDARPCWHCKNSGRADTCVDWVRSGQERQA